MEPGTQLTCLLLILYSKKKIPQFSSPSWAPSWALPCHPRTAQRKEHSSITAGDMPDADKGWDSQMHYLKSQIGLPRAIPSNVLPRIRKNTA